ncbi:MAG: anti-sigma factor [Candidatus Gastranaerophilaceae bacterium]|jgi:predicted anti-sigma-YlaC factor YlaD
MYKNLSCKEVEELLSTYMDNEISQGLDEAVELHLDNCQSCTEKLSELEKIRSVIRMSASRQENSFKGNVFVENLTEYLDEIEDCQFTEENIDDYIDKELDSSGEMRIRNHLKRCKYCRYDYENLLELRLSLKNYFDKKVDDSLEENDLEKIISRIAKVRLMNYVTASVACIFAVSVLTWFSVNTVYPAISKLDDGKSIKNINLKHSSVSEKDNILKKSKISDH